MVLDKINSPNDLKVLSISELETLAEEMRTYLLTVLSKHPGHFAPNFGTVELAIAVHTVFNTPHDKLIWDIGHQAYPHKLLTGRLDSFETLRQTDGISGFLSREESKFDVFGAGHSSTSISAALGIAAAIPNAAEIEVLEWPAPKTSNLLSSRLKKPLIPSVCRNVSNESSRPVSNLWGYA